MKTKPPEKIIPALIQCAARAEGITPARLVSRCKDYPTARARMAVCYVAHEILGIPHNHIGLYIQRARDSVRYASRVFTDRITVDPEARAIVERLVKEVVA